MKSPSEIARIARHTYYKLRMKIPTLAEPEAMKDDIETLTKVITEEVEQAITAERQRQERLVEALEKMCVSHENLYKAHFGETSNPMDDCIRREAQQVLKEVK